MNLHKLKPAFIFPQIRLLIVITLCVLLQASCSKKYKINTSLYQFSSKDGKPEYSNLNYWAAHPWKQDPSDSVPEPLLRDYNKDSTTDVFFIHPTTQTSAEDKSWNAAIDDSAINIKTDYSTILYQASAFNEKSRLFAPRYRQAHMRAFFDNNKLKAALAFDLAYADIKKAFEYYLQNLNKGQPIVIAAHSQGTIHAARLLKDFFDNKPLQQKLVCAYLLGMPAPQHYFKTISSCRDSNSTGCFVSWRTYKRNYTDTGYIAKEKFKSDVTNPLTWDSSTRYAPATMNTGGIMKNFNKIKKGIVDAQIHENVLWTSKPKFFGNIFLTEKNYHIGDINLFYNNIRQNVRTRITNYIKH